MNRASVAISAIILLACGDRSPLGSRVTYEIYEVPHPLVGGEAGSCTPRGLLLYPDAQALKWASGTNLEVHTYWPDRTDCTGFWNRICPSTDAQISIINAGVWNAQPTSLGTSAEAIIAIVATKAGAGGFQVAADGTVFSPDFVLTVDDPVAIWFERANGPGYGDVVPGRISELNIAVGHDSAIAVTLRNAAGEHLCGPVPATIAIDSSAFSLDRLTEIDYVNLPYHVIAGGAPGVGSIQFSVGNIKASLLINVTP